MGLVPPPVFSNFLTLCVHRKIQHSVFVRGYCLDVRDDYVEFLVDLVGNFCVEIGLIVGWLIVRWLTVGVLTVGG